MVGVLKASAPRPRVEVGGIRHEVEQTERISHCVLERFCMALRNALLENLNCLSFAPVLISLKIKHGQRRVSVRKVHLHGALQKAFGGRVTFSDAIAALGIDLTKRHHGLAGTKLTSLCEGCD